MLPQAKTAVVGANEPFALDNGVSPVIYTSYAVVDPIGDSASGRAEETIFFHKKFAQSANFL
jgi:hypothetical protein